jgi:hypothetical protein
LQRFLALLACALGFSAFPAHAQALNASRPLAPAAPTAVVPLQIPAGAIVNFQLQTRMKAAAADVLSVLPKGTLLRVKLLDAIDSAALRDGSAFRGLIVSSVANDDRVVIHSDAQVRGLFALLRSASHPEGFQYQLLVTNLIDRGQSYTLTAFLDPDAAAQPQSSLQSVRN